jgi:hypothetical protein
LPKRSWSRNRHSPFPPFGHPCIFPLQAETDGFLLFDRPDWMVRYPLGAELISWASQERPTGFSPETRTVAWARSPHFARKESENESSRHREVCRHRCLQGNAGGARRFASKGRNGRTAPPVQRPVTRATLIRRKKCRALGAASIGR